LVVHCKGGVWSERIFLNELVVRFQRWGNLKIIDPLQYDMVEGGKQPSCRVQDRVGQGHCATGEGFSSKCQWPNVVVPLVRTAALLETGQQVIGECRFKLKDESGRFSSEE
jgi:hypothetical protein